MRLVLEEPFKRLWSGRDPFEAVEALQGKVYRLSLIHISRRPRSSPCRTAPVAGRRGTARSAGGR